MATSSHRAKLESGQVAIPLVIDLSWARSDLMGLTCPFCSQVLDWKGLRLNESDPRSPKPGACSHLEFASTECLPFDENVSQISEPITMLKDLCILFKNRFIDGDGKEFQFKNLDAKSAEVAERNAAEGITQFSQKLISNLKDGYHFIKPGGYYHRYLEFVDYELEATTQLANEWISLDAEDRAKTFQESTSVESMSEEFRQAEEYEEQIREDVGYWDEVEMDPGIVEDFPYINQPPVSNQPIGPSKTASRFHELWIKDGTLRFNFNHFCQGKWEGEVISIFMAKIPLSDRCWSAIYSANLSVSEVLDSLGALDDAPPF